METNCKIYLKRTKQLLDAYVNDDGRVYYPQPCHGGYYLYPMTETFMNLFGVTIYPG